MSSSWHTVNIYIYKNWLCIDWNLQYFPKHWKNTAGMNRLKTQFRRSLRTKERTPYVETTANISIEYWRSDRLSDFDEIRYRGSLQNVMEETWAPWKLLCDGHTLRKGANEFPLVLSTSVRRSVCEVRCKRSPRNAVEQLWKSRQGMTYFWYGRKGNIALCSVFMLVPWSRMMFWK